MPSKMVTDRQKNATVLSAALKKHAGKTTDRFTRLVEPYLREGETVPDLIFFHELLQRRLAAVRQELVEVDDLLERERMEDSLAREQRDTAAAELVRVFVRLRHLVKGACGSDRCGEILSLDGAVPDDPVVLQRLGHNALARLKEGAFEGSEQDAGVNFNTQVWVGRIEGPLARLDQALGHLSEENQDTYDRQAAKNSLMVEYDKAYLTCARLLENFFRHVGMDELATKVRPSQRTSNGEPEEPDFPLPEVTFSELPADPDPEPEAEAGSPGIASRLLAALS